MIEHIVKGKDVLARPTDAADDPKRDQTHTEDSKREKEDDGDDEEKEDDDERPIRGRGEGPRDDGAAPAHGRPGTAGRPGSHAR